MLARNGMRQPQVSNEAPIRWLSSETAPVESSRPIGTPTCGQLPMRPRRLRVAPLHAQRDRAAPLAADADALDQAQQDEQRRRPEADRGVAVGSTPISVLAMPISSSVEISVALRPMRSPQWPKIAAPTGRAAKPTA